MGLPLEDRCGAKAVRDGGRWPEVWGGCLLDLSGPRCTRPDVRAFDVRHLYWRKKKRRVGDRAPGPFCAPAAGAGHWTAFSWIDGMEVCVSRRTFVASYERMHTPSRRTTCSVSHRRLR